MLHPRTSAPAGPGLPGLSRLVTPAYADDPKGLSFELGVRSERGFIPAFVSGELLAELLRVGLITSHRSARETASYMQPLTSAVLLDVFSRKVVGWATDTTLEAGVAIEATLQAIGSRKPPRGLVHHTDRGGQYTDAEYRKLLNGAGMIQSMSNPGNCLDNAMAESFFAALKTELGSRVFASRADAHRAVAKYIDGFYNPVRMHSALSYRSPIDFERQNLLTKNIKNLSV